MNYTWSVCDNRSSYVAAKNLLLNKDKRELKK